MKMHAREMAQVDSRHEDSVTGTSYFSSGLHFLRRMMCNALGGFCHLYLPRILLMRSGDVETNPGPERTVSEEEFRKLSKEIGPYYYKDLGVHLEISNAELDQIIAQHMLNYSEAFMTIFMRWRDKQLPGTDIRALLAERLERSDLGGLSGTLLAGSTVPGNLGKPLRPPDTQTHPAESQIKPLSPELVERCAKDFKSKYRSTLCKIRADPLNPASLVGFEKLYTNLVLEEEDGSGKRLLDYNYLLDLKVNGEFPKRIMVQGEAGAGKTTFCAKIAWDWLEGRYFRNHVWVLIVPLREFRHRTIGQIAKSYLTKDNPATPSQLTHYIRSNQDKVLIAFDGLDEFPGKVIQKDIDCSNSECHQSQSSDQIQHQSSQSSSDTLQPSIHTKDTCESPSSCNDIELVDIIRSDELEACPVLVTTRNWKAAEIRSDNDLMNLYSFIHIKGFSRESLSDYIHKYFPDEAKANRLIKFTRENDVVSDYMAHYPIYVAMLCLMWKKHDEQDLKEMKSLQTFSQIFRKMFCFLKEHYAQKGIKKAVGKLLNSRLKEISNHLKPVDELALSGLLQNDFTFSEDDFKGILESVDIACRVGLLSQENRIAPSGDEDDEDTSHMESTVFFPHKLFQEYMAAVHVASLYESDRCQFNRLLEKVVLPRKHEFRYFLYFAVSRNTDIAKHVMECLMQDNAEMEKDMDLLVEVAFESQDRDVAALLRDRVSSEKMEPRILTRTAHTAASYIFTGIFVYAINLSAHGQDCGPTISHDMVEMICSSPSLQLVDLFHMSFHDDFFAVLAKRGKKSKVCTLLLNDVKCPTPASSQNLAEALCSMPNLNYLELYEMDPSEEFSSTLNAKASTLHVQRLSISVRCPTPASSQNVAEALCSMPNLTDLRLNVMDPREEFYSTLKAKASTSKVKSISLDDIKCPTPAASQNLAKTLCSMPDLTELTMKNFHGRLELHEDFYFTLNAIASSMQVKSISLHDIKCPTPAASRNLAKALCSMPDLTDLKMQNLYGRLELHDDFYFALNAIASSMLVKSISLDGIKCSTPAASQNLAEALCSMPNLTDLKLNRMDPREEFYSTLNLKASTSKVKTVRLGGIKCPTPASSQNLAEALCSMPNLTDLTMNNWYGGLELHEDFYFTLNAIASSMQGCFPHISRGDFEFNGILQENLDSFLHSLADFRREHPQIIMSWQSDYSSQESMSDVQPSGHPQQQPMGDVDLLQSDYSQQMPMGDTDTSYTLDSSSCSSDPSAYFTPDDSPSRLSQPEDLSQEQLVDDGRPSRSPSCRKWCSIL